MRSGNNLREPLRQQAEVMYGKCKIHPLVPSMAGSYASWELTYTVGLYGIDIGGTLEIASWSVDQFEFQVEKPSAPNYVRVMTSSKTSQLRVGFDPKGHIRPWSRTLKIDIVESPLKSGDTVTILLGDKTHGSPGLIVPGYAKDVGFKVLVDCFGTGEFVAVPGRITLQVVNGPGVRVKVVAPSEVVVGEPLDPLVVVEDSWGNPCKDHRGKITIRIEGKDGQKRPTTYRFSDMDNGVHRYTRLSLNRSGIFRIWARDLSNSLRGVSNPIVCSDKPQKYRLFWGDIHGQTEETVAAGTVDEYFRFAREYAGLDFVAHAANDFQITKELWQTIQLKVKEYHQPGEFVVFLAYEWSGTTPGGGDNNVYFINDAQPLHRSSHWQVRDKSDVGEDLYPLSRLLETFRGKGDVMIIPHIGGRRANLDYYDQTSPPPVIEVCSVHGRFEWFLREALERGLKVGVVGSSDTHTCRPGADYPVSGLLPCRNGLVAIYAKSLTREGIWEAIKSRRCYATSGERIIIDFSVGGQIMGSEFSTTEHPEIKARVSGTSGLDLVEVFRGKEKIYEHGIDPAVLSPNTVRISWSGARGKERYPHRLSVWDGRLTLEKGSIVSARPFTNTPLTRIVQTSSQHVAWVSQTSGNIDGLVVQLDAPPDVTMTFNTPVTTFSFSLEKLGRALEIEAGGVDQKVRVSRAPSVEPPDQVEFSFVDRNIKPGLNAYWLRVSQVDGEAAWVSPIYVTYKG